MNTEPDIDIVEMFKYSNISRDFSASDIIFKQGAYADKMYVIVDGDVEIDVDGRIVATLTPGNIVGEMALVENLPRSATAIAKTNCRLVPIDRDNFIYIVKEHPEFALFIIKDLSNKIRELNLKLP